MCRSAQEASAQGGGAGVAGAFVVKSPNLPLMGFCPPRTWYSLLRRDWHKPEVEDEARDAVFTVYDRLERAVGREVTEDNE